MNMTINVASHVSPIPLFPQKPFQPFFLVFFNEETHVCKNFSGMTVQDRTARPCPVSLKRYNLCVKRVY